MIIRKAVPEDLKLLNDLMFASKGYWGYDNDFMKKFMAAFSLTESHIDSDHTFVAINDSDIIGFYNFSYGVNANLELENFFLHPDYIGKGNGKILWEHCIKTAASYGAKEFTIWIDPNTEEFYLKMGCLKIGERKSPMLPDRYPPILRYSIE